MAIDFFDLNDRNCDNLLFQITHSEFEELNEVMLIFRNMTGLQIDEYGTTKIYPDHVKLISRLMSDQLEKRSNSEVKRRIFTRILNDFEKTSGGLLAEG